MNEEAIMGIINKVAMTKSPKLILSNKRLTQFPVPLRNIVEAGLGPKIEMLDLSKNAITDIPEILDAMSTLQELLASHNHITAFPSFLPNLSQTMTNVMLDHNDLDHFPPALCTLTNLKQLVLHFNRIPAIPDEIANLSQLRLFNIAANQLTTVPDAVADLPELAFLQVSGNRIGRLPDDLGKNRKIRKLAIADNQELKKLPEAIGQCVALQQLHMNNTSVRTLPLSLADLPQLSTLELTTPVIISPAAVALGTKGIIQYLDLLEKLDVKKFENGGHWHQDDSVNNCKGCKAEFGFFKRKHHCRLCGCVFCSDCLVGVFSHPKLDGLLFKSKVCKSCEAEAAIFNGAPARPTQRVQAMSPTASPARVGPADLPRYGLKGAEKQLLPQEQMTILSEQLDTYEKLAAKERKAYSGTEKLIGFYSGNPSGQEMARKELDSMAKRIQDMEVAIEKIRSEFMSIAPPGTELPPSSFFSAGPTGVQQQQQQQQTMTPIRGRSRGGRGRGRGGTKGTPGTTHADMAPALPPRDNTGDSLDDEELHNRPLPGLPVPEEVPSVRVQALYDFVAQSENEINAKAGEVLVVLDDSDPTWWFVQNNTNAVGAIPSNYIKLL